MYRRVFLALVLVPAVMSQKDRTASLIYRLSPAPMNPDDDNRYRHDVPASNILERDPSYSDSRHNSPFYYEDNKQEQRRESNNDDEFKLNPSPIFSRREDYYSDGSKYDPPPIYSRRESYDDDGSKYDPPPIYSRRQDYYSSGSRYNSPPIYSRRESYYDDESKYNPPSIYSRKQDYYSDGSKYNPLSYFFDRLGRKSKPTYINDQGIETGKGEGSLDQDTHTLRDMLPSNDYGNLFTKYRRSNNDIVNTNININKNILDDYDDLGSI